MEATTKLITRENILEEAKWDLGGLYADESFWEEDCKKLGEDILGYEGRDELIHKDDLVKVN